MIKVTDRITAVTVEDIVTDAREVIYEKGSCNPNVDNTVASALNELGDRTVLSDIPEVSGFVADIVLKDGVDDPGSENYIDLSGATQVILMCCTKNSSGRYQNSLQVYVGGEWVPVIHKTYATFEEANSDLGRLIESKSSYAVLRDIGVGGKTVAGPLSFNRDVSWSSLNEHPVVKGLMIENELYASIEQTDSEIELIKSDVGDLEKQMRTVVSVNVFDGVSGYINQEGEFKSSPYFTRTNGYIPVSEGDVIFVTLYMEVEGFSPLWGYDSNDPNNHVATPLLSNGVYTKERVVIPAGVNYIAAYSRNENPEYSVPAPEIYFSSLELRVSKTEGDVEVLQEEVGELSEEVGQLGAAATTVLYNGSVNAGEWGGTDICTISGGVAKIDSEGYVYLKREYSIGRRLMKVNLTKFKSAVFYVGNRSIEGGGWVSSVYNFDCPGKKLNVTIGDISETVSFNNVSLSNSDEYCVEVYKLDGYDSECQIDDYIKCRVYDTRTLEVVVENTIKIWGALKDTLIIGIPSGGVSPYIHSVSVLSLVARPYLYIVGDSIIEGADSTVRFGDLLGRKLNKPYLISGRSGGDTDGLLGKSTYMGKIQSEIELLRPTWVMIGIGTNNGYTEEDLAGLYTDLKRICQAVSGFGCKVILNNEPCRKRNGEEMAGLTNGVIAQVRNELGLSGALMNVATSIDNDGVNTNTELYHNSPSDWVHPNAEGNIAMYERVLQDVPELLTDALPDLYIPKSDVYTKGEVDGMVDGIIEDVSDLDKRVKLCNIDAVNDFVVDIVLKEGVDVPGDVNYIDFSNYTQVQVRCCYYNNGKYSNFLQLYKDAQDNISLFYKSYDTEEDARADIGVLLENRYCYVVFRYIGSVRESTDKSLVFYRDVTWSSLDKHPVINGMFLEGVVDSHTDDIDILQDEVGGILGDIVPITLSGSSAAWKDFWVDAENPIPEGSTIENKGGMSVYVYDSASHTQGEYSYTVVAIGKSWVAEYPVYRMRAASPGGDYLVMVYYPGNLVSEVKNIDGRVKALEDGGVTGSVFPDTYMPQIVYGVIGDTLQVFRRSVVVSVSPYKQYLDFVCGQGRVFERYFEVTPEKVNGSVPTNLTISHRLIADDFSKSEEMVSNLVVSDRPSVSPESNINVLCIGASTTSSGQWPSELKRRLTGARDEGVPAADGLSNITFVGRKSLSQSANRPAPVKVEATGGWAWKSFYTPKDAFRFQVSGVTSVDIGTAYTYPNASGETVSVTVAEVNITDGAGEILFTYNPNYKVKGAPADASGVLTRQSGSGGDAVINYSSFSEETYCPFYDEETEQPDFAHYADLYCDGRIDVLIAYMGNANEGIRGDSSDEYIESKVNDMKVVLDALHADFPDCKVIVGTAACPNPWYGYEYDYGASSAAKTWTERCGLYKYSKAVEEFLRGDGYRDWCVFACTNTEVDSEYCYPTAEKAVNTRMTGTMEVIGTNGQHPKLEGYQMIADSFYRCFVNTVL